MRQERALVMGKEMFETGSLLFEKRKTELHWFLEGFLTIRYFPEGFGI